jgi:hypothetical protein
MHDFVSRLSFRYSGHGFDYQFDYFCPLFWSWFFMEIKKNGAPVSLHVASLKQA